MGWEGEQLRKYGPSSTPQPVPQPPTLAGFEPFIGTGAIWGPAGAEWQLRPSGEQAQTALSMPACRFVLEVSLRAAGDPGSGRFGLGFEGDPAERLSLSILPGQNEAALETQAGLDRRSLPAGFNPLAFHLLRVEKMHEKIRVSIDSSRLSWEAPQSGGFNRIQLFAAGTPAAFASFALSF